MKEGLELWRGLAEGYIRTSQSHSILGFSEVGTGKQVWAVAWV
jgi:hypothetical protein